MIYSIEKRHEIVSAYLYDGKTYKELSDEYHLPIRIINRFVRKYIDQVVDKRRIGNVCTTMDTDEMKETNVDITADEVVIYSEQSSRKEQEISEKKTCDFQEAYSNELQNQEDSYKVFPDFIKYKTEEIIDIVVMYLSGKYTILELADKYKVSSYIIFGWIVTYYDEAENFILARKYMKIERGKVASHPYTKKFRHVVCRLFRMGVGVKDISQFFKIADTTVRDWNKKYEELDDDIIDLDSVLDDFILRRKAIDAFEENKELSRAIKKLIK